MVVGAQLWSHDGADSADSTSAPARPSPATASGPPER